MTDGLALSALLVLAIAVTLLANWLVSRFQRPAVPRRIHAMAVVTLVANALWIALIFASGVIATRYVERFDSPVVGFLAFAVAAFLFSVLRALLARRIDQEQLLRWLQTAVHILVYLIGSAVLYLFFLLLLGHPATPISFVPLFIGALVPSLESLQLPTGRPLKFLSQTLKAPMQAGGGWHSLSALAVVAVLCLPLVLVMGWQGWILIPLGFGSHLFIDLFRPEGVPLFWPVSQNRYRILGTLEKGSMSEAALLVALIAVSVLLLLQVDVGQPRAQAHPPLSFEQNLERYYAWRGRNQVFARVEGAWQTTGRRLSGQFEVINAEGETLILLDRYDGTLFTAGKQPSDNLYVNSLSLSAGPAVRVKPVELRLKDTHLTEALLPLYQMEMEEGLQHIYVSGEIRSSINDERPGGGLLVDLEQTHLRKIESPQQGHYVLRYLTAAELIDLAGLFVEAGNLVVVATYTVPAAGPTPTPLPLPPVPTSGVP